MNEKVQAAESALFKIIEQQDGLKLMIQQLEQEKQKRYAELVELRKQDGGDQQGEPQQVEEPQQLNEQPQQ
jgi:hypothetical protein